MADDLAVWMNGILAARIGQERGRLHLAYTEETFRQFTLGVPLLSLSLPVTRERYTDAVVRPFLDGLLPEEAARRAVARDTALDPSDTYGLIRALGRDCAGAVVIQPADEPPPRRSTTLTAERLGNAEIAELVANLRSAPLGAGGRVRVSLAGVQEKLLLTRMPDGAWGRPIDGTPSTHILKPEIASYPHTVQNEAFCMRVARHLGLEVASVETTTINHRELIIVERYDRVVHPDGSVDRLHQEDLCQATGTPPSRKYEEDRGPSLTRVAEILQSAKADSVEALLRAVTLNALIGNGDAHAKNFSLLHHPSGALGLAPLYDLLSTLFYGDDHLAMYIDSVRRTNRVTAKRIVAEAARWGLPRQRASEIIADILDRAPVAVASAQSETPGLPPEIPAIVYDQIARIKERA